MSDLLYPHKVSGDKYNEEVLGFIPLLTYTVAHKPGEPMAVVFETASTPRAKAVVKAKIPAPYYQHLDRLLWRYYLWYRIYKVLCLNSRTTQCLHVHAISMLQHMLVLMDKVVEQLLLGCIALGDDLAEDSRFRYFDFYLATEMIVGYHDPLTVDVWRSKAEHRELDLERIDPFDLGRSRREIRKCGVGTNLMSP